MSAVLGLANATLTVTSKCDAYATICMSYKTGDPSTRAQKVLSYAHISDSTSVFVMDVAVTDVKVVSVTVVPVTDV